MLTECLLRQAVRLLRLPRPPGRRLGRVRDGARLRADAGRPPPRPVPQRDGRRRLGQVLPRPGVQFNSKDIYIYFRVGFRDKYRSNLCAWEQQAQTYFNRVGCGPVGTSPTCLLNCTPDRLGRGLHALRRHRPQGPQDRQHHGPIPGPQGEQLILPK